MKGSIKFGFLLVLLVYCFSGCVSNKEEYYKGRPLEIAVVGTVPSYNFDGVNFVNVNIDDLFKTYGYYDALFVTEETFSKTSEDKYIDLYRSLPYPTFFIGLNEAIEAFVEEGFSLRDFEESQSVSFAQGYYKYDEGRKYITFVPPEPLETEEDYHSIYIEILYTIDGFQY
ncbi:hypothetical protein ACFSCX_13355 [Bacillus salitolerans]|uniref:Lipoprotein n=1 Tax=Bacillus salitolerans TaxID=1437434 RepID=A0ABW4LRQ9_9BACI